MNQKNKKNNKNKKMINNTYNKRVIKVRIQLLITKMKETIKSKKKKINKKMSYYK